MSVPSNFADRDVCIVGLGYVGLTLAVVMAEVGFNVRGVERDPHILRCVGEGRAHFREKDMDSRLAAQVKAGRLTVAEHVADLPPSSVYIITVGTPVRDDKSTNLDAIGHVADDIANVLRAGDMVMLRSTVRVGVSRQVVAPILDSAGVSYNLAFCPERSVEGKGLEELRTLPQIVGGDTEATVERASAIFEFMTPTLVPVHDLETAEMVKLVNNTQRDLMFGFANEIAMACDQLGVSAQEVIRAGSAGYARAAMPLPGPVGGPCLEKDPYILAEAVAAAGGSLAVGLTGRRLNEQMPQQVVNTLADHFAAKGRVPRRIAIAGLAFKGRPETSDLRGSLAIPLIAELKARFPGVAVCGFDPAVPHHEAAQIGAEPMPSPEAVFDGADAVVFQTNSRSFDHLDLNGLSGRMAPGGLVYDLWTQFPTDNLRLQNGASYAGYGSLVYATRFGPFGREAGADDPHRVAVLDGVAS